MRKARRTLLKTALALPLARMLDSRAQRRPMKRTIPATGESIAAVGLGTWQVFDVAADAAARADAREALRSFVELGGELVDSSPMYGSSEAVTGDLAAELGVHRRIFV